MNIGFKIAIFTLVLNIAAGIISTSVPLTDTAQTYIDPIKEEDQGQEEFKEGVAGNSTLPGATGSGFNVREILLDTFLIGRIIRLVEGVGTLIFGAPEMIYNSLLLFTPEEDPGEYIEFLDSLRTTLITFISFAYGLGAFFVWTNRRVNT